MFCRSARALLFVLFFSACGRIESGSDLNIVGGKDGNVMDNLVKFEKMENKALLCGSGVVVHPNVVLGTAHCAAGRNFEELTIDGHKPIAIYTIADILQLADEHTDNADLQYFRDFPDYDLMVLLYDFDIIAERKMEILRPIAEGIPLIDDAIGVVGLGASLYGDKTKATLDKLRYGVNKLDGFELGVWTFAANLFPKSTPMDVGLGIGDSGAVILDASGQVIGIGSNFEYDKKTKISFNEAIDLTAAPAKRFFDITQKACTLSSRKPCIPWFPGSRRLSHYALGVGVRPTPVYRDNQLNLMTYLDDFAERRMFVKLPVIDTLNNSYPMAREGQVRTGETIRNIAGTQLNAYYSANLALYADWAKGREISFRVSNRDIKVRPKALTAEEIASRSYYSSGVDTTLDLQSHKEFGASVRVVQRNVDFGFRALEVSKVAAGSVAAALKIQESDEIEEINFRLFRNQRDIEAALKQKSQKTGLQLLVRRGSQILAINKDETKVSRYEPRIQYPMDPQISDTELGTGNERNQKFIATLPEVVPGWPEDRYLTKKLSFDGSSYLKIDHDKDTGATVKRSFRITSVVTRAQWKAVMSCYPEDMLPITGECKRQGSNVRQCKVEKDDNAVGCLSQLDVSNFMKELNSTSGKLFYELPKPGDIQFESEGTPLGKGIQEFTSDPSKVVAWTGIEGDLVDLQSVFSVLKSSQFRVIMVSGIKVSKDNVSSLDRNSNLDVVSNQQ